MNKSYFLIFLAWIIALIAMLGSLFFSIIMEFVPCTLCWYQRIVMYPLVIIFAIDLFYNNINLKYSSIFVLIGLFISTYHNLIQYGIIPESASPCMLGVSCSSKYINIFGFITIPMLSLIAFTMIAILLFMSKKYGEKSN